MHELSLVGETP